MDEEKPQHFFEIELDFPETHPGDILVLTVQAANGRDAVEKVRAKYRLKNMFPRFLLVRDDG